MAKYAATVDEKNAPSAAASKRNYQIDALKWLFTLLVFLSHTSHFIGENTRFAMPNELGFISVIFFFAVSGLLMVVSINRKNYDKEHAGQYALDFVINKFKGLALPYLGALVLLMPIYAASHADPYYLYTSVIPEIFAVEYFGFAPTVWNGATWYISAMLIAMLFLSYLLIKNKDFFIYIYTPVTTLLALGYLYQNGGFISHMNWFGYCRGGIFMAAIGLGFGVISYTLANKLSKINDTKRNRIILTIIEVIIYLVFFYTWLLRNSDTKLLYCVMLLLPIMIAIVFSKKSYISNLFNCGWMKCFGSLSLYVYLNHWAGRQIVSMYMPNMSYKKSLFYMTLITIAFSVADWLLVKLIKFVYTKHKTYRKNTT